MNSNDRIKYSEKDLINVLNRMFNIEELETAEIEFERLTKEATESIIEKIFQFKNDIQRIGYLNYLLKKFFDDGKGDAITSIAKPLQDAFYKKIPKVDEKKDIQYKYIKDCYSILHHVLEEISEHCLVYPNIDFPELLNRNFKVHNVSPFYLFVIYSKPKTTEKLNENSQSNGGRPKKEIDENMTLKSIMHDGLYKEAKEYYQKKEKEGKLKSLYQYGQLIKEFASKDWITPTNKTLLKNDKQMQILILNEFKINVSESSARGRSSGGWNAFADLEKKYPKTFIS